jgi:ubiquinone/menaquinone biosynthesis C-methylase UbiE
MIEWICCPVCRTKMVGRGSGLECQCGYSLQDDGGFFGIGGPSQDKGEYFHLYTEEYYRCPQYDYTSYRLDKIVALARPSKGRDILDLGCGPGEIAVRCAQRGAEVCGVDVSRDALRLSAQRAKDQGQKLTLIEFDGKSVPFCNQSFDAIIMSDVVEHIDDQTLNALAGECQRMLKAGGWVVIHTSPTRDIIRLSRALKRLTLGLVDLHSRLITPEYEHLHIRYHNARSLGAILRNNGLYPSTWGESKYLENMPHLLRKVDSLSDQLWCMAFKDPQFAQAALPRPYLGDTPCVLEMGKDDDLYINYGLYSAEESFRWTARQASLFIMVPPGASKLILELFSTQPQVELKMTLGRRKIGQFRVEKGMHSLSASLDGVKPGVQDMTLELDRVFVPKEDGISQDDRELGVAVCRVSAI